MSAARQTVYFRADPEPESEPLMVVAGEPGKSGLHGDWLAVARAIQGGADNIDAIAWEMDISRFEAAIIIQQMGYLIVHDGPFVALEARGIARLNQAIANGR